MFTKELVYPHRRRGIPVIISFVVEDSLLTFELRLLIEDHDEWPGAGAEPEGGRRGAHAQLFLRQII